jgi:hypothetical protein
MNTGSCAAERYEPRQVRKEAAVNSKFWVPQEHLVGAGARDKPEGECRQWVHGLKLCHCSINQISDSRRAN